MENFDLVIIGSGPGGYIAAIRAAQLGFKTACIEKDKTLGGTCLNVGCIPSKAMLESSYHFYRANNEFKEHGIEASGLKLNLTTMLERKNKVVSTLTGGVDMLFKKNKVTRINGFAQFESPNTLVVKGPDGTQKITGKNIIIATGSVPGSLPGLTIDEKVIVSSTGALDFEKVPKKLVVIGGGFIGLEMGSVWSRLGAEVEVVEFLDTIIPNMDEALSRGILRVLKSQGIKFSFKTSVQSVDVKGDAAVLTVKTGDEIKTLEADRVLVSVGRKPYTDQLGLDKAGVKTDQRGFVQVDANYQTGVPGIYAIGDVIGGLMLAHKAEEEGVCVAELIAGQKPKVNYRLVPGILYTHPEVAASGATEAQLKKDGIPYNKGQFTLRANGRAISSGEVEGFVKILAHKETDEILGAHIMGPAASEMIHELCLAMEFRATAMDVAMTMHGHPTVSEAIKEACLSVHGHALNG